MHNEAHTLTNRTNTVIHKSTIKSVGGGKRPNHKKSLSNIDRKDSTSLLALCKSNVSIIKETHSSCLCYKIMTDGESNRICSRLYTMHFFMHLFPLSSHPTERCTNPSTSTSTPASAPASACWGSRIATSSPAGRRGPRSARHAVIIIDRAASASLLSKTAALAWWTSPV